MPVSTPEPIARRKLSDEVFDRLKHMIASGEVPPGEALPSERELMERFGVGRPAIREAMQTLGTLGLIAISHGERARVVQVTARALARQMDLGARMMLAASPASLDELKQARRFFESGIVREAALRAASAGIHRLGDIVAQQRAALGDVERFIAADMRFHAEIAVLSGNAIFAAVSEAMLSWLGRYHTDLLVWSGNETLTLAEHDAIFAAIAARDADAAEAAMCHHLDRAAGHFVHRA